MDFNDSPDEAAFRARARAFLEANARRKSPGARPGDSSGADLDLAAAKAWQLKKAGAGFAGLVWPKAYGGQELGPIFHIIYAAEEAEYDVPRGFFEIGLGMCIPTLLAFATEEQKARFAGPALRGEEIWCQLFSEPAAGSDVAGLRMKAEKTGDVWHLTGQKIWTSGAHYSDYGIVLARSNVDVAKHLGLTMFFVDMKSPGIEVRPIKQMSGGSNFNEVFFDSVAIPDTQRLGAPGQGWSVALVTLMNERLAIGGSTGPDYMEIMELARGLGVLGDHAFRQKLADWAVRFEGLKLTRFRTMTALSKGEVPGPESAIGKIIAARQLQEIASEALDLAGEYGLISAGATGSAAPGTTPDTTIFHHAFFWAPGLRIAGGTDEVLRNIIAERVLGLPADLRADKDIAFRDLPTGA